MLRTELQQKTGLSEIKLDTLLNKLSRQSQWDGKIDILSDDVDEAVAQFIIDSSTPPKLKGAKQPPQNTVESPSSTLGLDSVDWTEALSQIGTDESVALALVKELDLNQDTLTISDVEVLRELAIAESVKTELTQSAQSLHDAQLGSFNEALEMAVDANLSQAELIGQAGLNAYLQESLRQTEIAHQTKTAIYTATVQAITDQMATLGEGKQDTGKRPNEIIQQLGQAATRRQAIATRKRQVRATRMGNYLN